MTQHRFRALLALLASLFSALAVFAVPSSASAESFPTDFRLKIGSSPNCIGISVDGQWKVQQRACDDRAKWNFDFIDYNQDGWPYYEIHSNLSATGNCMWVKGDSSADGAPIVMGDCGFGSERHDTYFVIIRIAPGTYHICGERTHKCLSAKYGEPASDVIQWHLISPASQAQQIHLSGGHY